MGNMDAEVTDLHNACKTGDYNMVKQLIQNGSVGVNAPNPKSGYSPLHTVLNEMQYHLYDVTLRRYHDILQFLLENNADSAQVKGTGSPLTAFHICAVLTGNFTDWAAPIKMFLNAGTDPNLLDTNGNTILHALLLNATVNHHDIHIYVEFLVKEVHCDPCLSNNEGRTILHICAAKGLSQSVKTILRLTSGNPNFNIDITDNCGNTALILASEASFGRPEYCTIAYDLLSEKAAVHIVNQNRKSALHVCTCSTIADLLIGKGACANQPDRDNATPLHYIYKHNVIQIHNKWPIEVLKVLLKHGADIYAKDKGNNTPLLLFLTLYLLRLRDLHNRQDQSLQGRLIGVVLISLASGYDTKTISPTVRKDFETEFFLASNNSSTEIFLKYFVEDLDMKHIRNFVNQRCSQDPQQYSTQDLEDRLDFCEKLQSTPKSLLCICSKAIRSQLQLNAMYGVQQLTIPTGLKTTILQLGHTTVL